MSAVVLFLWLRFLTGDWSVATEVAPGYSPETPDEQRARVEMIDAAIAAEAVEAAKMSPFSASELAIATKTKWHRETRLSHAVHAGFPGQWGSDHGRARCLAQLHASGIVPTAEWETLAGLDAAATRRCARATMRMFSTLARYCRTTDLSVVFSAYATGSGCRVIPLGKRRADGARKLLARL
jgi:hypothetical protein